MRFFVMALMLGGITHGTLAQTYQPPLHPECCKLYALMPTLKVSSFIGFSPQQCSVFSASPTSSKQLENCYAQLTDFLNNVSNENTTTALGLYSERSERKVSQTLVNFVTYGFVLSLIYFFFALWFYHTQTEVVLPTTATL